MTSLRQSQLTCWHTCRGTTRHFWSGTSSHSPLAHTNTVTRFQILYGSCNYFWKKNYTDKICAVLLWDVLAELDCLLLPAHDLVEDVVTGRGLAHGAAVVRVGEGLAVLLRHLPEVALAGHEGDVLRLVLQFLEKK